MKPPHHQLRNTSPFAIACVCRQAYLETAKLYYGLNTFFLSDACCDLCCEDSDSDEESYRENPICVHRRKNGYQGHLPCPTKRLRCFLAAIGPVNAACIVTLSIDLLRPFCAPFSLFDRLPNLQLLLVDVNHRTLAFLKDFVEAREGTGTQLKLKEGIPNFRVNPIAECKRYILLANELLAVKKKSI